MEFKYRIKELREFKGLTQKELADELTTFNNQNVSVYAQTISYWENGREPNINMLISLSKYFDVSIDYLVGNSDVKQTPKKTYFSELETEQISKSSLKKDLKPIVINNFSSLIQLLINAYIDLIKLPSPDYKLISYYTSSIKNVISFFIDTNNSISLVTEYFQKSLADSTQQINSIDEFKYEIMKIINSTNNSNPISKINSSYEFFRMIDHLDTLKRTLTSHCINHSLYSLIDNPNSELNQVLPFIKEYLVNTEYSDSLID